MAASFVLHAGVVVAVGFSARVAVSSVPTTAGSWAGSVFEVGVTTAALSAGAAEAGTAEAGTGEAGSAEAGTAEAGTAEAGTAEAGTAEAGIAEVGRGALEAGEAEAGGRGPEASSQGRAGRRPEDVAARAEGTESGSVAQGGGGEAAPTGDGAHVTGLGGEDAVAAVGHLPAAFTRALPAAARGDRSWLALTPGLVGRGIVRAQIDETGALSALELEMEAPPPQYVRLMRIARVLLGGGRFALPPGTSGEHRLGLEVWLDDAAGGEDGEGHHVRQLASRHPTVAEPGEALVVFNSGRRVKLRVFLEPTW